MWDGNKWELLFQPILEPNWWWESIVDEQIQNGGAHTITGEVEDDKARIALEKIFKNMPLEKATTEYLYHSQAYRNWSLPTTKTVGYDLSINDRDYDWFAAIAGVRWSFNDNKDGYYGGRNIPEDCHTLIAIEYKCWGRDAHSHSWVMINELMSNDALSNFKQIKWLKEHVNDQEHTRMTFWFDN